MKKGKMRIATLLFTLMFALSISASAVDLRASDYIDWYEIDAVSTGGGDIAIRISVDGTGRMTALGAEEITVYEKINGRWMIYDYFDRDDSGMVLTDTFKFVNTIYVSGYANTEYKISATIFAEDSTGSDSRTQVVYVNT